MNESNDSFYLEIIPRHRKVTGSSFWNTIYYPDGKKVNFVVDFGAAQGEDNDGIYNGKIDKDFKDVRFIVLTHAHTDHYGLLPVAIRNGFRGYIYTHYATAKFLEVSLYDSCKYDDPILGYPIATEREVEETLRKITGVVYKRKLKPYKGVEVTLLKNGHLVGSAVVLVKITYPGMEDIRIIYTGDYKEENVFYNKENLPEEVLSSRVNALICESTYGDIDSSSSKFKKVLKDNIKKALSEGKTILLPSFALGKTQEVLLYLKTWIDEGEIPADTEIILDGKSAEEYTRIFRYKEIGIERNQRFCPANLYMVPPGNAGFVDRQNIFESHGPKIIIASGGMCSQGMSVYYIKKLIQREDVVIHLLGYCSPDTYGYQLINSKKGDTIEIEGYPYVIKCDVLQTFEMSGHSPRDVQAKFIEGFKQIDKIIINHGEEEVQKSYRKYLIDELEIPDERVLLADRTIRIDSKLKH